MIESFVSIGETMKKGYEEVHIPAIRSIVPKVEKLIELTDLPPWTHAAFEGMDKLNCIQPKIYFRMA